MANNLKTVFRLIPRIGNMLTSKTKHISTHNFSLSHYASSAKNYPKEPLGKLPLSQIETKMHISFTCKVCNTRNHKQMSKIAYKQGVVIIECTGCSNNHLIADNLKWFTDLNGKRNIEDILKEKGESVTKVGSAESGNLEIVDNSK